MNYLHIHIWAGLHTPIIFIIFIVPVIVDCNLAAVKVDSTSRWWSEQNNSEGCDVMEGNGYKSLAILNVCVNRHVCVCR